MPFNIYNRRYTGSKYKLKDWISKQIKENCQECSSFLDLFAGTGIVTYALLDHFKTLHLNDFLYSNNIIYRGFFCQEDFDLDKLAQIAKTFQNLETKEDNYISINYGGKYFSVDDARKIGMIREKIEEGHYTPKEYAILLSSLLYSLDRCANTVGHYDAYFHTPPKDSFRFELIKPINTKSQIHITRQDANLLEKTADVVYIDPPYSSRQYSRFYHVLENITKFDKTQLSGVALKPPKENMSKYSTSEATHYFAQLINDIQAKYIVVSYNNTYNSKSSSSKNKMSIIDLKNILQAKGEVKIYQHPHPPFNAGKTSLKNHKELLFIVRVGHI